MTNQDILVPEKHSRKFVATINGLKCSGLSPDMYTVVWTVNKLTITTEKIGDLILSRHNLLLKRAIEFIVKLAPRFQRPYAVLRFESPTIMKVEDKLTRIIQRGDLQDVKPFP